MTEKQNDKPGKEKRLILFGVGVLFQDCYPQLLTALGRKPDFLCDNAPEKWGQEFFGIRCISPAELPRLGERVAIVITGRRYEEISRQLRSSGITEIYVACFDRGYDVVRDIQRLDAESSILREEPSPPSLQGKWTLITGASRGIGRQIAMEMAKLGSHIVAHSRRLEHTTELIHACRAAGVEILPIAAELGNPVETEEMLERLTGHYPPIDIVFNNAAVSIPCGPDPWDLSSQDYLAHYMVNTVAPIRICYRLIPPMIRRGFGRVIQVTSTIQRKPSEMAYACSKAAINKFVHDLIPSLRGTGVRMSLVCPGYVRSDMGGPQATFPLESVIPGVLLGALLDEDINGRWFIAQDYAGLSLSTAMQKARFYHGLEDIR